MLLVQVVIGTYEHVLVGYNIFENDDGIVKGDITFTDKRHGGPIRTIDISPGGILASGADDEIVRIFCLKRKKEIGSLTKHSSGISHLNYHGRDILISSGQDGQSVVWLSKSWKCLATLKTNDSPVISFVTHPCGKLGLSVGTDRHLKTWDMVSGKCVFIVTLPKVPTKLLFNPSGSYFAILYDDKADFYSVEVGEVSATFDLDEPGVKLTSICFCSHDYLACIGLNNGSLAFFNLSSKQNLLLKTDCHSNRVKAVSSNCSSMLVSAGSDGKIKLWKYDVNNFTDITEVTQVSTNLRITCMGAKF